MPGGAIAATQRVGCAGRMRWLRTPLIAASACAWPLLACARPWVRARTSPRVAYGITDSSVPHTPMAPMMMPSGRSDASGIATYCGPPTVILLPPKNASVKTMPTSTPFSK